MLSAVVAYSCCLFEVTGCGFTTSRARRYVAQFVVVAFARSFPLCFDSARAAAQKLQQGGKPMFVYNTHARPVTLCFTKLFRGIHEVLNRLAPFQRSHVGRPGCLSSQGPAKACAFFSQEHRMGMQMGDLLRAITTASPPSCSDQLFVRVSLAGMPSLVPRILSRMFGAAWVGAVSAVEC